jgi:hypothetical protein
VKIILLIKIKLSTLRMIAPRDLSLYYPNPAIYTLGKRRKEKKRKTCMLSL